MSIAPTEKIESILRGTTFTEVEADRLTDGIQARTNGAREAPKPTAYTAYTALDAVYAAIERHMKYAENGDAMRGLASLVNALEPVVNPQPGLGRMTSF